MKFSLDSSRISIHRRSTVKVIIFIACVYTLLNTIIMTQGQRLSENF